MATEIRMNDPALEAKISSAKVRIDFLLKNRRRLAFKAQINLISSIILIIFSLGFGLSFLVQLPWTSNSRDILNLGGMILIVLVLIIVLLIKNQTRLSHDITDTDSVINDGYSAVEFAEKSLILKKSDS